MRRWRASSARGKPSSFTRASTPIAILHGATCSPISKATTIASGVTPRSATSPPNGQRQNPRNPVSTFPGEGQAEPAIPFAGGDNRSVTLGLEPLAAGDKLVRDVELVLAEVDQRVAARVEKYYPRNALGDFPWGYVWTTTLPCDQCKRHFPLIGSLVLQPAD